MVTESSSVRESSMARESPTAMGSSKVRESSTTMKRPNETERFNEAERLNLREFLLKIGEWIRYLFRKWLYLLVFVLLGAGIGLLYTSLKKPTYLASSTIVLYEGNGLGGKGLSQYAGIASLAGINLGDTEGGIFQGDNIMELYRSRSMIEQALRTEVQINQEKQLLIHRYIDFHQLRKRWKGNPPLASLKFQNQPSTTSARLEDSILAQVVRDLSNNSLSIKKLDNQSSIIKVDVKSKDQEFAHLFNKELVKTVNDFYIQSKTLKSLDNVAILQHQTDSVKNVMERAVYSQASTMEATAYLNPTRQTLRSSIQKGEITVEINKAILSELIKNLEMSKMLLLKETPLIQVLDSAKPPLENVNMKPTTAVFLGAFISLIIGVMILLIKKIVSDD